MSSQNLTVDRRHVHEAAVAEHPSDEHSPNRDALRDSRAPWICTAEVARTHARPRHPQHVACCRYAALSIIANGPGHPIRTPSTKYSRGWLARPRNCMGKERSSPALISIPSDLSENPEFKVSASASSLYLYPVCCQLTKSSLASYTTQPEHMLRLCRFHQCPKCSGGSLRVLACHGTVGKSGFCRAWISRLSLTSSPISTPPL